MRKGFTLIELLAVIVILAIIAIIAVPTISNVVKKARKGAAEASALNYIDAVEKYVILHDMNPTKYPYDIKGGTFKVASTTEVSLLDVIIPKAKAEGTVPALTDFITVKGDKPKSGTITTNEKGKVTEADIVIKGYSVDCTGSSCNASTQNATLSINGNDGQNVEISKNLTLTVTTNIDGAVTWSSSNPSIATVNNGVVTGVSVGEVTITAEAGKAIDTITIAVIKGGPTKVDAQAGETHKGIVYLDPTDLTKTCNATLASRNVDTTTQLPDGVETGCMKWYIFKENSSSYYAILNHNIHNGGLWHQQKAVSYESSFVINYIRTLNWNSNLNTRIILPTEINEITGIESTNEYYLDGSAKSGQGTSKYAWLFDYTYDCTSKGCNYMLYDYNIKGYWVKEISSNYVSEILYDGRLYRSSSPKNSTIGIRPVIEVDKSLFE